MFVFDMRVGPLHGVTVDVSTVHNFHVSADNPSLNGTLSCSLCHQDLDLALSQRAQAKVDKFREGYAAPGLRHCTGHCSHAFLPAIVSSPSPTNRLMRIFNNITIRFNLARTYTHP